MNQPLEIVNNLKSLLDLLQQTNSNIPLTVDLSLVQTIDYYTGIVFKAVSLTNNQWHTLAQGGRYDQLLATYHPQKESACGIGFAFNIESLHACLLSSSAIPPQKLSSDYLVIPQTSQANAAAFNYAQKMRHSIERARVELYLTGGERQTIYDYARDRQIDRLIWIQADGNPIIETIKPD